MSSLISVLRDPVPYQGALGLFATVWIDGLNGFVGLLVGIATLVYLCLRIRRDLADDGKPNDSFKT